MLMGLKGHAAVWKSIDNQVIKNFTIKSQNNTCKVYTTRVVYRDRILLGTFSDLLFPLKKIIITNITIKICMSQYQTYQKNNQLPYTKIIIRNHWKNMAIAKLVLLTKLQP